MIELCRDIRISLQEKGFQNQDQQTWSQNQQAGRRDQQAWTREQAGSRDRQAWNRDQQLASSQVSLAVWQACHYYCCHPSTSSLAGSEPQES